MLRDQRGVPLRIEAGPAGTAEDLLHVQDAQVLAREASKRAKGLVATGLAIEDGGALDDDAPTAVGGRCRHLVERAKVSNRSPKG